MDASEQSTMDHQTQGGTVDNDVTGADTKTTTPIQPVPNIQLTPFVVPPASALMNNPSPANLQQYAIDPAGNFITTTPCNTGQPISQQVAGAVPSGQLLNNMLQPTPQLNLANATQPMPTQISHSGANAPLVTQSNLQQLLQSAGLAALQNQAQNQQAQGNFQIVDNANLAAYLATLSNPSITPGTAQSNNMIAMGGNMLLSTAGSQVLANQQTLANNNLAANSGMASFRTGGVDPTQLQGQRAYELLAVHHTRRSHQIRADSSRMKQLKDYKTKLLEKPLQPLEPKHATNFMDLSRIPGWYSAMNRERVTKWSIRGAELFRQTLIIEIEAEMVEIMARRDLLIQDEQAGSKNFALVATVRNDLKIWYSFSFI